MRRRCFAPALVAILVCEQALWFTVMTVWANCVWGPRLPPSVPRGHPLESLYSCTLLLVIGILCFEMFEQRMPVQMPVNARAKSYVFHTITIGLNLIAHSLTSKTPPNEVTRLPPFRFHLDNYPWGVFLCLPDLLLWSLASAVAGMIMSAVSLWLADATLNAEAREARDPNLGPLSHVPIIFYYSGHFLRFLRAWAIDRLREFRESFCTCWRRREEGTVGGGEERAEGGEGETGEERGEESPLLGGATPHTLSDEDLERGGGSRSGLEGRRERGRLIQDTPRVARERDGTPLFRSPVDARRLRAPWLLFSDSDEWRAIREGGGAFRLPGVFRGGGRRGGGGERSADVQRDSVEEEEQEEEEEFKGGEVAGESRGRSFVLSTSRSQPSRETQRTQSNRPSSAPLHSQSHRLSPFFDFEEEDQQQIVQRKQTPADQHVVLEGTEVREEGVSKNEDPSSSSSFYCEGREQDESKRVTLTDCRVSRDLSSSSSSSGSSSSWQTARSFFSPSPHSAPRGSIRTALPESDEDTKTHQSLSKTNLFAALDETIKSDANSSVPSLSRSDGFLLTGQNFPCTVKVQEGAKGRGEETEKQTPERGSGNANREHLLRDDRQEPVFSGSLLFSSYTSSSSSSSVPPQSRNPSIFLYSTKEGDEGRKGEASGSTLFTSSDRLIDSSHTHLGFHLSEEDIQQENASDLD
uniref:Uncharacterized protein n=1 Tax=Chromera velia CCMP2878 TaxID=1169474 RepID=A0A0G4IEG9_9ALVE|eukprot:Cvel_13617.t1-p1 / transcript=Cvel_13617.t1 / gene=Cvel_13617 / organism=Chromera_velia_CCMP2878 / gene_product=hypothetical protein / transcript_product=hypothetical protein / location=Cvel_scaffold937:52906-56452(-) / protein_length=694 / sequence_SO=supercontig / SO=protein_coding / is_pseudo=false